VECRHKPSDLYSRIKVASELTTASGGLGLVTQVVVASKTGKQASLQWCVHLHHVHVLQLLRIIHNWGGARATFELVGGLVCPPCAWELRTQVQLAVYAPPSLQHISCRQVAMAVLHCMYALVLSS